MRWFLSLECKVSSSPRSNVHFFPTHRHTRTLTFSKNVIQDKKTYGLIENRKSKIITNLTLFLFQHERKVKGIIDFTMQISEYDFQRLYIYNTIPK